MDRFVESLDELDATIERMRRALDGLEAANAHTRDAINTKMRMADLFAVSAAPRSRDAVIDAMNAMHSVLMRSRGEFFHILVDEEAMTISEVARLVGHPRQLVKRRYDAVRPAPEREEGA